MLIQMKDFFSFIWKITFDVCLYTYILVSIIGLLPNSLFKDFPLDPKSYTMDVPDHIHNWNNYLNTKSEYLLEGIVVGPESLAERDGFIYTGVADGRLLEINKKTLKVRDVFTDNSKTESNCDVNHSKCRILGLRFHSNGQLFGIDYYNGLFRLDVKKGLKEWLPIGNNNIKGYYDDFEFDPNMNVVYITVITTKWSLYQFLYGYIDHDDSGYLFAYDLDTKTSVKLRTRMLFPNGLQLSKDKKHLFIAETLNYRISKISVTSLQKAMKEKRLLTDNEIEVFSELPGEPDNIRLDTNGDLLIGMGLVRNNGKNLYDYLSEWPFIRKAIGRTAYCFAVSIDFINSMIGSNSLKIISSELYTGELFPKFVPKTSAVIKLDGKSGQIKQYLGSELFIGVTEAIVDSEGDLYFGSFYNPFLGRVKKGNH